MKKQQNNSARASALQITLALALISVSAILFASSLSQATGSGLGPGNSPDRPMPDSLQLVGPVVQNMDLRDLPYVAPNPEIEQKRLTRYPHPEIPSPTSQSDFPRFDALMKQILPPTPTMPAPILTFDGMNSSQSGCLCLP